MLGAGIVPPGSLVAAADDPGLTRGDGCFEGCRVLTFLGADGRISSEVHKLELHLARMARSAAVLQLPFDAAAWRELVASAMTAWTERAEPGEAALKLLLTRGGAAGPMGMLRISPFPERYPRQRRDGISAITLPRGVAADSYLDAPWLLGGVKTLSYAINMAAEREAERRGADEVVFLASDGSVLEAPTSTVVWWDGQSLCTPPRDGTGILGSTTQQLLFETAAAAGWSVRDARTTVAQLLSAESVWLVSSVRGPVDVVRIDAVPHGRDADRTTAVRRLCGF